MSEGAGSEAAGVVQLQNEICEVFTVAADVDWGAPVHPVQLQMAMSLRPIAHPLSRFFLPLAVSIGELSQERAVLQKRLVEFVWGSGTAVQLRGSANTRHFCVVFREGLRAAGGLVTCGEGFCGRAVVDDGGNLAVLLDQPHRSNRQQHTRSVPAHTQRTDSSTHAAYQHHTRSVLTAPNTQRTDSSTHAACNDSGTVLAECCSCRCGGKANEFCSECRRWLTGNPIDLPSIRRQWVI